MKTILSCGSPGRVPRTVTLLAEARELRRLAVGATSEEAARLLLTAAAAREDKSFALARWLSEFRADPVRDHMIRPSRRTIPWPT